MVLTLEQHQNSSFLCTATYLSVSLLPYGQLKSPSLQNQNVSEIFSKQKEELPLREMRSSWSSWPALKPGFQVIAGFSLFPHDSVPEVPGPSMAPVSQNVHGSEHARVLLWEERPPRSPGPRKQRSGGKEAGPPACLAWLHFFSPH